MSDQWLIGQAARVSGTVTDAAGVAADPGGLALKVKAPNGTVTTYPYGGGVVLKDAVGSYHADLILNQAGAWTWRWEATAPNVGADEGTLQVRKSAVV